MCTSFSLRYFLILHWLVATSAYGVGGNPDNTWYALSIYPDSLYSGQVSSPTTAFASFAEAESAMRQLIPFGSNLVLRDTSTNTSSTSYYYHIETEDVIPGNAWSYRGHFGGYFNDSQSAIDQFFEVNQYGCKTEDGPLGAWEVGSVWNCYPPPQPNSTEIATYNLQICEPWGSGTRTRDVDPIFCRVRQDSCPEHTPHFVADYQNTNPEVHGGGRYCYSNSNAVITEFKCKCNETGVTRACKSFATQFKKSFDKNGTFHYYTEAVDPQYNPINCPEWIEIPEIKDCSTNNNDAFKGNPVNITSGCKVQHEVDYTAAGNSALSVARNYTSTTITAGLTRPKPFVENYYGGEVNFCSGGTYYDSTTAGSRLTHGNLGWSIAKPSSCPIVILYTPNGSKYVFDQMVTSPGPGTWYEANDPRHGRVQQYYSYYYYYDKSGKKYAFTGGQLQVITQDNKVTRFKYNAGNLESVIDAYGNELKYAYDENAQLKLAITPDGTITYNYDNNGNLTEVVYPDDTPADDTDNPRKQYLFEDSRFPNALTGMVNENGVRYASWTYDEYGRAISSEHEDGADRYEFEYPDGTTTLVRRYVDGDLSHESIHNHARYNGRDVVTSIVQSNCENCTVGDTVRVYDPQSGDLISSQDPNGILTTYEYDDRHRQIKRTTAVGTPEEVMVETVWDQAINKPLRVIEPNRITEYTYDTAGHLLSKIQSAVE